MTVERVSGDRVSGNGSGVLSDAELNDLLEKTSRTFAVSIPLLDEPTRRRVGLSYLLLRIADNFEDAARWPKADRVAALERFIDVLSEAGEESRLTKSEVDRWVASRPQEIDGYLELISEAPRVIESAKALGPLPWRSVRRHVTRSARGMIDTVERSNAEGRVELRDLEDLRAYCYLVAGIVGELLTELFVLEAPSLERVLPELEARAARFGEGLQLVNIVKDEAADALEGRRFLPPGVELEEVFELARRDLEVAQEYVELMRRSGTPPGHLAFTALPVRLAWDTLSAVESDGAGAKISRSSVLGHVMAVRSALEAGGPLFEG